MARFVGFIGPSYTLRSVNVDAQRCVNLFPEMNELGTGKEREVAALVGRPGLVKLATMGSGPGRGLYESSKLRTFAVSGTGFYEVTTPTAPVLRGTITTSSGRVGMADNGVDLILVDGAKAYTFRFATNVFAEITDPDFAAGGTNTVQFLDQYILVNEPDTGRFWFSALSDATSWDGLDFQTAEGAPDNVVALIVDHRELILAGEQSIEMYINDGVTPFARIGGGFLEEGIAAGATLLKLDNSVFWLGKNKDGQGIVRRLAGTQAQRISTHAVEQAIAGYTIAQATAFGYQDKGHSFYVLNFPEATWVFDAATGLWHERSYTPTTGQPEERHRAEVHCFSGGLHLVADYANGNLYKLDDATYTDDGAMITWRRVAPHLSNSGKRLFFHMFQLDLEAGVGLASGQGSDPVVFVRWSNDGGHTWSNERSASMGKIGEYRRRAIVRRMGSSWVRTYDVRSTEPIKQVWIGANLDVSAGA